MDRDSVVELAGGMRLQWEAAQSAYVLLYPEGMIKLNRPAAEILLRCDGRPVGEVVSELEAVFPGGDLTVDVLEFLEEAAGKGWVTARE